MFVETSGNIRNQIGTSLNTMRHHRIEGDILGMADEFRFLVSICAPKLSEQDQKELALETEPTPKDKNGVQTRALFRECMEKLSKLLCILSDKGLYSYKDVPIGDASELSDGLTLVPEE